MLVKRSPTLALALLALLLSIAQTTSTETYAFPYYDSAGPHWDPATNKYYQPVFDLGIL
jgi:hypothetical protein